MLIEEELTGKIIDSAIEVYMALGLGLLESAYENCFRIEFQSRGLEFESKVKPGYRLDMVGENKVILELKVV